MDNSKSMDNLVQAILDGEDIATIAGSVALKQEEPEYTEYSESSEQPPNLDLHIASNRMHASLTISPAYLGQTISPETILEYLNQNGVCFGIREGDIREYCRIANYTQPLVCAVGKEVQDETDGQIKYHFDTEKVLKPAERSDGSLDFRELGLVKNIAKGEVLCSLIPASPGTDGMDVLGNAIPAHKGRAPSLPVGTNTQISEDGNSLISLVDGTIEMLPGGINVNEVYVVRGDVGPNSGNITAKCSVLIQGDVRSSFFVKAGGDIIVRGIVEHARLEAGRNIVLSQGMNGGGKGFLKAGGNISGKFFENTILEAAQDIYANIIMSSTVRAGGSLILNGTAGSLIAGDCQVGRRVYAKNIGNSSGSVTRVQIESRELNALLAANCKKIVNPEILTRQIESVKQELSDFDRNYQTLSQQFITKHPPDGGPSFKMIQAAAEKKKDQYHKLVQELESKLNESRQSLNSFLDFHVIATGIIFPGTKIVISNSTYNVVKETSNAKFYLNFEGITFGPVLPSDAPDTAR